MFVFVVLLALSGCGEGNPTYPFPVPAEPRAACEAALSEQGADSSAILFGTEVRGRLCADWVTP